MEREKTVSADRAKKLAEELGKVKAEQSKVIVGQERILDMVIVALLAGGHILLEGLPGLAKTLMLRTLAEIIGAKFQRVQFTPDLLPADITGITIYNAHDGSFSVKRGPIFSNLVLADEINRAPAKVQSALLEAMEENQVTIGEESFALPKPFIVLATQNPIEQEGTYPLPEAQLDRFMMKLHIEFPNRDEERQIIERMTSTEIPQVRTILAPKDLLDWREIVSTVYIDDKVREYVLDIIFATRNPNEYGLEEFSSFFNHGASPRATLALIKCSRAYALLKGRSYVIPDDVKAVAYEVLRHRVSPSYEAQAANMDSEELVRLILSKVKVP